MTISEALAKLENFTGLHRQLCTLYTPIGYHAYIEDDSSVWLHEFDPSESYKVTKEFVTLETALIALAEML